MKEIPVEVILKENLSKPLGTNKNSLNVKNIEQRRLDKFVFVTQKSDIVGGETNFVLNALVA